MNHKQRLQACIAGEKVDRPPVALWRHFPVDDQDPALLARSILLFQETYDFDFVKLTPASTFCLKDLGVTDLWKGNPEGAREIQTYPVKHAQDWSTIRQLDPYKGFLGEQLECIKLVKKNLPSETPVIQTIFDPLSQAKNLVGKENLLTHLRQNPDELFQGLRIITNNTSDFVRACAEIGIDGFFFATQHAQASLLSMPEVEKFLIPFDQEILKAAADLWLNVTHIHGSDVYFTAISKIPAQIINWHDQETPPSLAIGKQITTAAVCGGLRQWETLAYGSPDQVANEAQKAIESTDGIRFILGTGCVLPIISPHSNILAARQAVHKFR